MRTFTLTLLLAVVLATTAKSKGGSRSRLGYRECKDFKSGYKNITDKAMKWVKPKPLSAICGVDGECPEVEELANRHCGFGIRKIAAGKWVSTHLDESDGEQKYNRAFMRLFGYISGTGNDERANIPMTSPVIVMTNLDESYRQGDGSMHFYIPSQFQENTPNPTNEDVEIEEWEDVTVYYRSFGYKGLYVSPEVWEREFGYLARAIVDASLSSDWSRAITGTFTQPGVGEQRHEVMFVARGHYSYYYETTDFSWKDARGYKDCKKYPDTEKPKAVESLCGNYAQCPAVEDVETNGCGYGKRKIKAGSWVSTEIFASDGDDRYFTALERLANYIGGQNEDSQNIEMTVPVITKNYLDENFDETRSTMHFYLPPEFHENPPAPTDDLVEIEEWADTVVFYRTFGDDITNIDVEAFWEKEFTILGEVLAQAEEDFFPYVAITASFTRPGYGQQRHEAMFMQVDEEE
ncbi:hypothetical protein ACHWQZ_G013424 [Mnemiopsis leidyi]